MKFSIFPDIEKSGISEFFSHTGFLLKSNVGLYKSLDILRKQQYTQKMKNIISSICSRINEGKSFGDALNDHPEFFSQAETAAIKCAEEHGCLTETLISIGKNKSEQIAEARKIKTALIYPSFILVCALAIFIGISSFIASGIAPLYQQTGTEMNPILKFMMICNGIFTNPTAVTAAGAIFAGSVQILRKLISSKKKETDLIFWALPFVGKIIQTKYCGDMCRMMEILYSSGCSLDKAAETAGTATGNEVAAEIGRSIRNDIENGESLTESFLKYYPKAIGGMIETGEETGRIKESLAYISSYCKKEYDRVIEAAEKILEPALIGIMGAAVGVTVTAILSPLSSLVEAL